jgi:opine dehydrogenase
MTTPHSVTVLGAGHGGLALAGYLARRGHRVALWNRSAKRVAGVAELGGVWLAQAGGVPDFSAIAVATSDPAEALAESRVVLVAVPASGHAEVARTCARHLRDGQAVLLLPGRTGGALEFRRVLRESGCRASILLGEANTFPFASRAVGPADAVIFGTKSEIRAAALPASRTPELVAACKGLLPMLAPARSVLHTGLSNLGAILHPVITLLNADRIRAAEPFDFYTDGVTPRVAAALAAADSERMAVARAYGVTTQSLTQWVASAYNHHSDDVREAVGGNPAYRGIKAPTSLAHRYLLEDVPTGLVPLLDLGEAAGQDLPVLRGLVKLARQALGGELWQGPRTLEALGLDGMSAAEIRSQVQHDLAAPRASVAQRFAPAWELVGAV